VAVDRFDDGVRVLGPTRLLVARGQVDRDRVMTPPLELGYYEMPEPAVPAGARDEYEGPRGQLAARWVDAANFPGVTLRNRLKRRVRCA